MSETSVPGPNICSVRSTMGPLQIRIELQFANPVGVFNVPLAVATKPSLHRILLFSPKRLGAPDASNGATNATFSFY
jgi:hypothetical protein